MAELPCYMNVKKLDKSVTLRVNVRILREMKMRIKIATFLIRLAAVILGCSIEVVRTS